MTTLNLMAGGPTDNLPADWQQTPGSWAGIDRGTLRLLQAGITPIFSVGDYDSLTDSEYDDVATSVPQHRRFPPEKDFTDTQLALLKTRAMGDVDAVNLFGATGGRLDHELANLYLPLAENLAFLTDHLVILDAGNRLEYLTDGQKRFAPRSDYRYFGVVCLTPVVDLTIRGAKYPLTSWSSTVPFSWASNEFIGETPIDIAVAKGTLALIYSRDRRGQKTFN